MSTRRVSWTQFQTEEARTQTFQSIQEAISVGLMLEHLHQWFMLQPGPEDIIWTELQSTPPLYLVQVGTILHPGVVSADQRHFNPKIKWCSAPEVTDRSTSLLLLRLILQCTPELQQHIRSLHPDWTWMTELSHSEFLLPESIPSLLTFLQHFSTEISAVPVDHDLAEDGLSFSQELEYLIASVSPTASTGFFPPMDTPCDAALPYLTTHSQEATQLLSTHWHRMYAEGSAEYIETARYACRLQVLRRYFQTREPRENSGTAALNQLYKAFYPKDTVWIEYTRPERLTNADDHLFPVPDELRVYTVPEPNYNHTHVLPAFSSPDPCESRCWVTREWVMRCVLGLSLITKQDAFSECSVLIEASELLPECCVHFVANLFPTCRFTCFGTAASAPVSDQVKTTPDPLTPSRALGWAEENEGHAVCVIADGFFYELIFPKMELCWGIVPFAPSTDASSIFSFWDGIIFYPCWGKQHQSHGTLVTNCRSRKDYNARWILQHLHWNNVVGRNQVRALSGYPSTMNQQWDTIYEYTVWKHYLQCQGVSVEPLTKMKELSQYSESVGGPHLQSCFELGYRPCPLVQQQWESERSSPNALAPCPLILYLFMRLVYEVPDCIPLAQKVLWQQARHLELSEICGMYCYDHVKYLLLQKWMVQHQPTQGDYTETKYASRVNEINGLTSQLSSPWKPRSLLDFGGGAGGVASKLGEQHQIPKGSCIVSEIESWYGHPREQVYANITYQTLVSSRLPFSDGQFDTIVCLMVLHHVPSIPHTLSELRRVMQHGGLLIVREHDAQTEEDVRLIDIEHSLYRLVTWFDPKISSIDYLAHFQAQYLSMKEWTELLGRHHFEEISIKYNLPQGFTKCAYRLYRAV